MRKWGVTMEVFDLDGRRRCARCSKNPGWRRVLHTSDTSVATSSLQHDIIQEAAKTQSVAACARKKLGRGWVGAGGGERSFPTAARGADYYHFWARSLPVQGPAQTAALARIPQRSPPPPAPSSSFLLLPRAGTSCGSGGEEKRGGPAAASGSPPPTEAAFISTDEPYGAPRCPWREAGAEWGGGVVDKNQLTSRQEAICTRQINSTAAGSVRGAAST